MISKKNRSWNEIELRSKLTIDKTKSYIKRKEMIQGLQLKWRKDELNCIQISSHWLHCLYLYIYNFMPTYKPDLTKLKLIQLDHSNLHTSPYLIQQCKLNKCIATHAQTLLISDVHVHSLHTLIHSNNFTLRPWLLQPLNLTCL